MPSLLDELRAMADRLAGIEDEQKSIGRDIRDKRRPRPELQARRVVNSIASASEDSWTGKYKHLGEFAMDIYKAATYGVNSCPNLVEYINGVKKANPTGLGEMVGADGGVLVPTPFLNQLLARVYEHDLLSRITMLPTTSNSLKIPAVNETSRANGSRFGGVEAKWRQEASTMTQTDPSFHQVQLNLESLYVFIRVTDELLQDSAVALQAFLEMVAQSEIQFKLGDAIVRGDGTGKPLGILNAPSRVTQAAQAGQPAATIVSENVSNMWRRLWGPLRPNSVWLINQEVEAQLDHMTIGTGAAGWPVYVPPGGLSDAPYGTLKGRPVLPVEFCSALGTEGDIILTDLSQWLAISQGGVQTAVSMHLYFNTGEQAFRFTIRFDGEPWWTSSLTPYQGTDSLSWAVTLATRA